ncbi:MAG: PQQ-binding-like beta-propeller repeat protein, partial [Candidatus Sumerlaeota bacterium]|nr:PQQ-binding-like beta-propeller repeat protein [Candidatus Sumerlaeota bacterium]
ILDAATGKELACVPETAPVRQIVSAGGVALVLTQGSAEEPLKRNAKAPAGAKSALVAVKGATGAVLWRKDIAPLANLSLAIDKGRVMFQQAKTLVCLDFQTGKDVWQTQTQVANARTLVANDGIVLLLDRANLEARDGATGKPLWNKQIVPGNSLGSEDLFVINGVVWPGMSCADEKQNPVKKGENALAVGYDLKTGAERKRVFVPNLISPEHHHRCYRNKATDRYIIASMEGEEFLDLQGTNHCQNNFVRGACKLGIMPCNGMLYSPADQCFCEPGAKLLGFKAIGPAPATPLKPTPDDQRLERGAAYAAISNLKSQISNLKSQISNPNSQISDFKSEISNSGDWPTYRYNAARHGATPAEVGSAVKDSWRTKLGGALTAPVAVGDRVYVASRETHTLHALELATGRPVWTFVAGGRIDSPPTVFQGMVLFGSSDGWVYCLRADDGALAWRFLAALCDRRIASFDQIESVWPVHGSVLIRDGIAYVAAGRSTYLDGGIRLYALEPQTGKMLHSAVLSGPFPDGKSFVRDVSFFIQGANSDVLSSEGNSIFMRQKRLTPSLQEEHPPILSNKGESDVGMHVFSTAGFLDDSWYGRAFWMYSKRWPGFQLANQSPKSGQLLVVDEQNTYAVSVFYRRNLHTTMFFPGKEGYLLFADKNSNEPQIVGEPGARPPVAWLPQSDYMSSRGLRTLNSEAFGLDKMIGYTRAEAPLWTLWLPVRIRAMVKAADVLFVAGPPDAFDAKDPYSAFEGRKGASLVSVSAKDGKKIADRPLDAPPIFDGMIAAGGRLLISLEDGSLVCLAGDKQQSRATASIAR